MKTSEISAWNPHSSPLFLSTMMQAPFFEFSLTTFVFWCDELSAMSYAVGTNAFNWSARGPHVKANWYFRAYGS